MEKSVKITLIIAATIILLVAFGSYLYMQGKATTISTSGSAEIKALPDIISVYALVETNASSAEEAKNLNSEITDKLINALISQGIEREDIITESYNVYPDYEWTDRTNKFIGYKASHSIKIQLSSSKTEKVGTVIDKSVEAGALIRYINFELSLAKQNEYKAQALNLATQDAKIKAESIASGLDKDLGNLVSVSDSSFDYRPWPIYAAGGDIAYAESATLAKQATTNIQPGEETVTASVSVTYKVI